MTRFEIIKAVSSAINISHHDAQNVVLTFFKTMKEGLSRGEIIELRGLGTFGVKRRKASIGRNVKTGEVVAVSAHPKVFYRLGRELKRGVRETETDPTPSVSGTSGTAKSV
jgi:integration host factor subunit beta